MFFNPDVTYDNAIKNEDKGVLKALLTGIIGSDPTFVTSEFDEAVGYIRDKSIELNGKPIELEENYLKQEDEYKIEDNSKWDEHYYQMQLVWLRDNFSLTSRLSHIKEVGKYVYRNKITLGKSKIENRDKSNSTRNMQKERLNGKKSTVVKTTGDDFEDERLLNRIIEWSKDHWYIIVIILLAVIAFCCYKAISKGVS